jgi:hypothetical protein
LLTIPGNSFKRVWEEEKLRTLKQVESLVVKRSAEALSRKKLDSQHSKAMVPLRRDSGSANKAKLRLSAWAEAILRRYVLLKVVETTINIRRRRQRSLKRSCNQ